MAQLSLSVGQMVISVPIKLDNQQLRAVLRRYALNKGLPLEGKTDAEIAQLILRFLLADIAAVSLYRQRQEAEGEMRVALEAQLKAENELVD